MRCWHIFMSRFDILYMWMIFFYTFFMIYLSLSIILGVSALSFLIEYWSNLIVLIGLHTAMPKQDVAIESAEGTNAYWLMRSVNPAKLLQHFIYQLCSRILYRIKLVIDGLKFSNYLWPFLLKRSRSNDWILLNRNVGRVPALRIQ